MLFSLPSFAKEETHIFSDTNAIEKHRLNFFIYEINLEFVLPMLNDKGLLVKRRKEKKILGDVKGHKSDQKIDHQNVTKK